MSRAKRLQVVLELAEQHERTAADALEQAREQKDLDEKKLEELSQYCEDYELAFRRPQPFMRADEIQRQRGFLVQLHEARDQQLRIVEQRIKVFNSKQQIWQKAHLKRKAMGDLIVRFKQDEARVLSKQEEKMLDEWFNQTAPQRQERTLF